MRVAGLVSVAAGPDADAIHAAVGKVGEACKACHEAYRGPKQD
jgi:cytochrome c556